MSLAGIGDAIDRIAPSRLMAPKCPNEGKPCFCTGQCKSQGRTSSADELLTGFLARQAAKKNNDVFYFYKGNIYKHIDEIGVKNPTTREWDAHVLYQNVDGQLFSREINEFYQLFSEVKDNAVAVSKFKIIQSLNR